MKTPEEILHSRTNMLKNLGIVPGTTLYVSGLFMPTTIGINSAQDEFIFSDDGTDLFVVYLGLTWERCPGEKPARKQDELAMLVLYKSRKAVLEISIEETANETSMKKIFNVYKIYTEQNKDTGWEE